MIYKVIKHFNINYPITTNCYIWQDKNSNKTLIKTNIEI